MIDLSSTSVAYFAEAAVSAALFLLLYHYYKVYHRPFLFLWSLSWATAVISLLSLAILTLTWHGDGSTRHILSFVATASQTSQMIFLLLGSSALTFQTLTTRRHIILWIMVSLIIGIAVTVPFAFNEDAYTERYMLRVGFRYLSMLIAFLIAGYWVGVRYAMTKSIGQKLIAVSFFLFALYQFYYIGIIIGNSSGLTIPIPGFFGIIEVVTISLMGLSMVIYLLEDEHLRLIRANTELANFLYRTSHDLRSPIATLLSITMLAKRELKDSDSLKYMEMIEDRSKKLDSVIADILKLSRKKSAIVTYEKVDFNLSIRDIFEELRLRDVNDTIELQYREHPGNSFLTDKAFLHAALTNIVENSVKYRDVTKKRSFILIEFEKVANQIVITVTDNGQGILAECLPRVFEMFFRANADIQGTGLGLYIVADLITKLNGKVSATSVYAEYTTIRIVLPNLEKG